MEDGDLTRLMATNPIDHIWSKPPADGAFYENIPKPDPRDTPFSPFIGLDAAGKFTFRPSSDNTKYEWMEDTPLGWREVTHTAASCHRHNIYYPSLLAMPQNCNPGHILEFGTGSDVGVCCQHQPTLLPPTLCRFNRCPDYIWQVENCRYGSS